MQNYDYSAPGGYFITFCTKNKEKLFWSDDVGTLSPLGELVEQAVMEIPLRYERVSLDQFAVMPNHVHLLLLLEGETVSVSRIVNQLKGVITKRCGRSVWQKLFHDRIVRNDAEYRKIWTYIDQNPLKWELDCFYCE